MVAGDTVRLGSKIAEISRPHHFSLASWEVLHFPRKWLHGFTELFPGQMAYEEERIQVLRYFELTDLINDVEARLHRVAAGLAPEEERAGLGEDRGQLLKERGAIELSVERIMEGLISNALRDQGADTEFLLMRTLWPPVDFHLGNVPKLLIVSPRDKIQVMETHLLDPGMGMEERIQLESLIDALGLSSLVENIAGVATYPSMIPDNRSLESVLITAAHEWAHHYLAFHPLGRGYSANAEMTTVNETVADIVGDEIGKDVYQRYFDTTGFKDRVPQSELSSLLATRQFDFNAEMRKTRLHADELLDQGKIDEAETYLEGRRLYLAENGYIFRKLNQAFFAFRGSYANRPGAVSPIGGQLRQVRAGSASLGDFLIRVAKLSSYEQLLKAVGEEN